MNPAARRGRRQRVVHRPPRPASTDSDRISRHHPTTFRCLSYPQRAASDMHHYSGSISIVIDHDNQFAELATHVAGDVEVTDDNDETTSRR